MNVEVKFFTSLREITGKKVEQVELQNTVTIDELVTVLANRYGKKFREYIYDKRGEVQPFLSFLVNGKNVNTMNGLDTKLENGDAIAILPPVGGG